MNRHGTVKVTRIAAVFKCLDARQRIDFQAEVGFGAFGRVAVLENGGQQLPLGHCRFRMADVCRRDRDHRLTSCSGLRRRGFN